MFNSGVNYQPQTPVLNIKPAHNLEVNFDADKSVNSGSYCSITRKITLSLKARSAKDSAIGDEPNEEENLKFNPRGSIASSAQGSTI